MTADDIFAWAHNGEGQLGNATTVSRYDSVKILKDGFGDQGRSRITSYAC
ncbi:hypothetical protein ACFTTN_37425 [Streptomyces niveus]